MLNERKSSGVWHPAISTWSYGRSVAPFKTLVNATYKNDGCIAYDVAVDPFDSDLIRFSELWPSQTSLDKHLIAPHIKPWRAVTKQCGLLAREFTAYELSGSRLV